MAESFSSNAFKIFIINESGVYDCVFGSTKPQAKLFRKWVTSEVLPSIRKTGEYKVNQQPQQPKLPENYLEALQCLVNLNNLKS